MSSPPRISKDKVDELLSRWNGLKRQKSDIEQEEEEIKELIKELMSETGKNYLDGRKYSAELKKQSRKTISRKDLPEDLWDKYCKTSSCEILYLKKR